MKNIFLLGSSDPLLSLESEFINIEKKLENKGYLVSSSNVIDNSSVESKKRFLAKAKMILSVDHIITMEGWHKDPDCVLLIEIARFNQIPVSHFSIINHLSDVHNSNIRSLRESA